MKYCEHCGRLLQDEEVCNCQEKATAQATSERPNLHPGHQPSAGKKIPVLPATLIAVIVLLVAVGAVWLSSRPTSVDLRQMADVSFTGLDSRGRADLSLDGSAFDNKINSQQAAAVNAIQWSVSPSEGLSNGDTVTVSATCSEDVLTDAKLKLMNTEMNFKVSGLDPVTSVDFFSGVELQFEGISPVGTVVVNHTNEEGVLGSASYSVDPALGLSNGDTVTVTLEIADSTLDRYAATPIETTKTYTVSGLQEYVTALADLDEESLERIEREGLDAVKSHLADRSVVSGAAYDVGIEQPGRVYGSGYTLGDVKLAASYMARRKYIESVNNTNNFLLLVYEAQIVMTPDEDDLTEDTWTLYYPVEYTDILRNEDGTIQADTSRTGILTGEVGGTLEQVYSKTIQPNLQDYSVTQ